MGTITAKVRSDVTWILFTAPRKEMLSFGDALNAWLKSAKIVPISHGVSGATSRARTVLLGDSPPVGHMQEEMFYALLLNKADAPKVLVYLEEEGVKFTYPS